MYWSEIIWVASFFGVVIGAISFGELLIMLLLKNKKNVDGGKGKIIGWERVYNVGDETTNLEICVECYINGIYYKEYVSYSSLRRQIIGKRWLNSKVGTEVKVKYDMDKKGKVTLYIYDIEGTKKEIILLFILEIISLIVTISQLPSIM